MEQRSSVVFVLLSVDFSFQESMVVGVGGHCCKLWLTCDTIRILSSGVT
jgi:hypothetical protein